MQEMGMDYEEMRPCSLRYIGGFYSEGIEILGGREMLALACSGCLLFVFLW